LPACVPMNCSTAMEHSCRIYRQHAGITGREEISADVRFGSLADICSAKRHVRFTPNSDTDCVFRHVRFTPRKRHSVVRYLGSYALNNAVSGGLIRLSGNRSSRDLLTRTFELGWSWIWIAAVAR
jgi:hypothetical protein